MNLFLWAWPQLRLLLYRMKKIAFMRSWYKLPLPARLRAGLPEASHRPSQPRWSKRSTEI